MLSRRAFLGGLGSIIVTPILPKKTLFFFGSHYQIPIEAIKIYKYPPQPDQDTGIIWKAVYNKPHLAKSTGIKWTGVYSTYANLHGLSDKEVRRDLIQRLNNYWQDNCQPIDEFGIAGR